MDVREKLVELLRNSPHLDTIKGYKGNDCTFEQAADWLIAHGVTVQEWILVTERLPEKDGQYLCNYHFGKYRGMTFTSVLDYYATDSVPHFQHTLGDTTMKVTHWMPLPEPPKGE